MFKFSDYRAVRRAYARLAACAAFALALSLTVAGTANLALAAPSRGGGHGVAAANSGSQTGWAQQKVMASNGGPNESFGALVAMMPVDTSAAGAAIAFIGAPLAASQRGAVYVFSKSNDVWTQTQELTASDGSALTYFGDSIAVSGKYALVGAPFADAVYVFEESNGSWAQVAKLTAVGASNFGDSVSIKGNVAVIGAPSSSDSSAGAVYVFTRTSGTWAQTAKLTGGSPPGGTKFGTAVLYQSQPARAIFVGGASDAVYVFQPSKGSWEQTQKLTPNDASLNEFGFSISRLSLGDILVGAPGDATSAGAAYIFGRTGNSWSQVQKLTAEDASASSQFGYSVSSGGGISVVAIGAPGSTVKGAPGAVYLFKDSNGTWVQTQKLTASDGKAVNYFGASVASLTTGSGIQTILAGAPRDQGSQGAAYFYSSGQLGLTVSAPASVTAGNSYVSEVIVTNSGSATSAPITVTAAQPAGAVFQSFKVVSGGNYKCNGDANVSCDFTSGISGNGGTAQVNITWKATGDAGTTITNTASLPNETPPLTASATTTIASAPPPPPPPPPPPSDGGGSFGWLALAALLGLASVGFGRRRSRL